MATLQTVQGRSPNWARCEVKMCFIMICGGNKRPLVQLIDPFNRSCEGAQQDRIWDKSSERCVSFYIDLQETLSRNQSLNIEFIAGLHAERDCIHLFILRYKQAVIHYLYFTYTV